MVRQVSWWVLILKYGTLYNGENKMIFTDDEQKIILQFLGSLSPTQLLQRFLNVMPSLIGTDDPGMELIISNLSAKSTLIQSNIDGLDAAKTAQQSLLTSEKAILDGLITKLSGG